MKTMNIPRMLTGFPAWLGIICLLSPFLGVPPAQAAQIGRESGSAAAAIGGCALFPSDNAWNTPVDGLPVHSRSDQWVNTIGRNTGFHMDFGSGTWAGGSIGIPYNVVGGSIPKVPVSFYYPDESDPGPYPIPASPLIEHGSDHHILIVETGTCTLYEIFDASYSGGSWHAGSGAIWSLNSNALRPDTWTSADAAGLPILPGLVLYDKVLSGEINHAIRFTAQNTNGYIWPARHLTSNHPNAPHIPPMGARFRLKASYDISGYPPAMQVILRAMKTYGIILADNGSNWYVSGAPDERWDNDMLHLLDDLTGNDFEAVDTSIMMLDQDSGKAYIPLFQDVAASYWSRDYIERLYNAGVTSGCSTSPRKYCPTTTVTRDQMAVFLLRGKHGSEYVPPDATGTFQDVPANYWAADWIEQLAVEGITSGCSVSPKQYCPATPVTRDQMAVFLLRARHGSDYVPPEADGDFQDVDPDYWAADWIEQLAEEGITSGCSVTPKLYCPSTPVTRDQMAVFLVRAFNLP